jgi:hypothetical protein
VGSPYQLAPSLPKRCIALRELTVRREWVHFVSMLPLVQEMGRIQQEGRSEAEVLQSEGLHGLMEQLKADIGFLHERGRRSLLVDALINLFRDFRLPLVGNVIVLALIK